jgi:hypothetical protein
MVKLQPSSSIRHDTALDSVQLFLGDIAENDLLSIAHGQATFFSLVKDQGAFSVTGDSLLMGKRFDEVTDDVLREARRAIEEQELEQAQKAASLQGGGRGHRRTKSCPPAGTAIESYSSPGSRDFDWLGQDGSSTAEDDYSDILLQNTDLILRALQVRLTPDEGFRKSGIVKRSVSRRSTFVTQTLRS